MDKQKQSKKVPIDLQSACEWSEFIFAHRLYLSRKGGEKFH